MQIKNSRRSGVVRGGALALGCALALGVAQAQPAAPAVAASAAAAPALVAWSPAQAKAAGVVTQVLAATETAAAQDLVLQGTGVLPPQAA